MSLPTQPYKGARDFYPEDKRLQKYLFSKMRQTVEKFGYEEYDAPILEPLELYLAKSSDEIVNDQTYAFEDRGGRQVVIRPEMTPTVSRMVAAKRQELAYPLRWYSIPNLWRYERPQRGRLREHWQLNVDLFGLDGSEAEQEIIMVSDAILKSLGAKSNMYTIKLNSRKFTNYILEEYLQLDPVQSSSMIRLIDRMHKIDRAEFIAQADALLNPSQRYTFVVERLLDVLSAERFTALPPAVQNHETLLKVKSMIERLKAADIENVVFDATLMRGFDYYTDIVFEVFDNHPDNNRSMFGGGRYDGLVGLFGVEPVPTVGFGMGDVTLANFVELHELMPTLRPETDAYVIFVGEDIASRTQKILTELRQLGLNLAVDYTDRKIGAQIKTAEKKGIQYVIIIGEQELAEERLTLKNLATGQEEKHSLARIVSLVKDYRKNNDNL
jgi:histidyl-tRNA synthetase